MSTVSTSRLIDTLEQGHLLTSAQAEEVRRIARERSPAPESLLQEMVRHGWLTAFQAQQVAQGRAAQLVLGSYLLLEPLGKGGSGQVFKARHLRMNRLVALKILRPDLVKDQDAVGRFYREIEAASRMTHPNLPRAYEAGPLGSVLVLVMEYVAGIDLERMVRESGPLPVSQACEYIRQAAEGLQYAHSQGLVHRDIKPSNLLVAKPASRERERPESSVAHAPGSAGTVKILDLGLARLQQPAANSPTKNLTVIAGAGVMMGTADYMAPEQAIDLHSADIRADIYSLGCTFFYLLTGLAPFGAATLAEKFIKHQQAEPPFELLPRTVPAGVEAVLRKMLAKAPPERYQTPGEVAAALRPFAAVQNTDITSRSGQGTARPGTGIRPPSLHSSDGASRRRRVIAWVFRRRLLVGLGLLLLVGLVAAGLWLGGSSSSSIRPQVANATTAKAAAAVTGDGLAASYFPAVDLTGSPVTRIDATVDFDWRAGAPVPGIPADHFSARWTGHIVPKYSETYTFFTQSDDGVRLWVNDQLIINNWTDHSLTADSGRIALTAGQRYPIKLEYYEKTGDAVMKLGWHSPSQDREIIPQRCLFSGRGAVAQQPTGKGTGTAAPSSIPGTIHITADNVFELYVNGALVGKGDRWETIYQFPVTLQPGANLLAVKGQDTGSAAGLLVHLTAGGTLVVSNSQWKTLAREVAGWNAPGFDDREWKPAKDIAPYGAAPWERKPKLPDGTPARWIWDEQPNTPIVYFRHVFQVGR